MLSFNPSVLLKMAKTIFAENFNPTASLLMDSLFMESSSSNKEDYPWAGQPPQMTANDGEVIFTPLSDALYTLTNSVYVSGVEFKRTELDDDQTGILRRRIGALAEVAGQHPEKLRSDTIVLGTTDAGYDGVSFYNATHPARGDEGGTQSNLLTGSGTTTAALSTDIKAVKNTMLTYKAENGEPFMGGMMPQFLMEVPPLLEFPALEAVNSSLINNTDNALKGIAQVVVNPRLVDTDDWYMHAVTSFKKPFVFQERDAMEFTAQEAPTDDNAFMREVYRYKARARYAAGYAYWQCSVKTTN